MNELEPSKEELDPLKEINELTGEELNQVTSFELWDNSKRAKILIRVFLALASLYLFSLLYSFTETKLLKEMRDDPLFEYERLENYYSILSVIGIMQIILYIVSIIVFLNWFRRAYGNLHRLKISKKLSHEEIGAVWAWFIPIVSLFRPVQIMNEIWRETQYSIKEFKSNYNFQNLSLVVGLWWAFFIISNIGGRVFFSEANDSTSIEELINVAKIGRYLDGINIIEVFVVVYLVYVISSMETVLKQEVKKAGGSILVK